jgi:hypothetical protein
MHDADMGQHTTDSILYALFCLSRDTRHIDAAELGRAAAVSTTDAARALIALERAGLVDASRARLTMLGLARAAALQAGGSGGPRVDLRQTKPRKQAGAAAAPIAAKSEAGADNASAAAPERARKRKAKGEAVVSVSTPATREPARVCH